LHTTTLIYADFAPDPFREWHDVDLDELSTERGGFTAGFADTAFRLEPSDELDGERLRSPHRRKFPPPSVGGSPASPPIVAFAGISLQPTH
jgi:hypothetical protein